MQTVYLVWSIRSDQYYDCSLPDTRCECLDTVFDTEKKAIEYILGCMKMDATTIDSIDPNRTRYRTFTYQPESIREGERYRSWDRIRSGPTDCDTTVHYYYESREVK